MKLFLSLFFLRALAYDPYNVVSQPCLGPACANPSGELDYQDFSVILADDGTYYRFSKNNATDSRTSDGLIVATAPAFRGPWNYAYDVLAGPLKNPLAVNRSSIDLWAPEIHRANGTYYLFYAIFDMAKGTDFPQPNVSHFDLNVATSKTMKKGSWTDHGSLGIPMSALGDMQQYTRLDQTLLGTSQDIQGVSYPPFLAFGSRSWGQFGVYLTDDLLSIRPKSDVIELNADQNATYPSPTNNTNGPYLMQTANYAYLFYHSGVCCTAEKLSLTPSVAKVEVCRRKASSKSMVFFDREGNNCATDNDRNGTIVLASNANGSLFAPGAVGALQDPKEGLVLYYQYYNISNRDTYGFEFGWNHMSFDAEGWPVLS